MKPKSLAYLVAFSIFGLLSIATLGLASFIPEPLVEGLNKVDLPEEICQVSAGDTLIIQQTEHKVFIGIYHGKNHENIPSKYLFISN